MMGQKFALVRAALFLVAAIVGFCGVGFSGAAQAFPLYYAYNSQPLIPSPNNSSACPQTTNPIFATVEVYQNGLNFSAPAYLSGGQYVGDGGFSGYFIFSTTIDYAQFVSNALIPNTDRRYIGINEYTNSEADGVAFPLSDGKTICGYSSNVPGTWTLISATAPTAANAAYTTPSNTL